MSTPVDIKAEAIALHAMGYPCREIEKQLKAKFPKVNTPNYATISRWGRITPAIARFRRISATNAWWKAVYRAAEIVHERMGEIKTYPLNKAVVSYGRMMDIAIALERLENEGQDKGNGKWRS